MKQTKLIRILEEYESNNEIISYKINDINIWPIIKIITFNTWFQKESMPYFYLKSVYKKLVSIVKSDNTNKLFQLNDNIDASTWMFVPMTTRETFKGKSIDKFGDPILDNLGKEGRLFIYHSTREVENFYKKERIVSLPNKAINSLAHKKIVINDFVYGILKDISIKTGLPYMNLKIIFKSYIINVNKWYSFYFDLLNKNLPDDIYLICYYNEPMFGLIKAAKELGIPTTDVQHGSLGRSHPAYHYSNEKIMSSTILPDKFWLWNNGTKDYFKTWVSKESESKLLVKGNPWMDFLEKENIHLKDNNEVLLLYTLQLDEENSIPDYLVDAIRDSPMHYLWWFRHHPRANDKFKSIIKNILIDNSIMDRIEMGKANSLPLPLIMKNVDVHFTSSSGAIIEANIINVPLNITISEIGKNYFENLINNRSLLYYKHEESGDFLGFIKSGLNDYKQDVQCNK